MAISDRQAAAIRRRKQDATAERNQADERRRLALVGFQDGPEPNPDLVGWFQKSAASVKGQGHLCIRCQPDQPLGFQAAMRNLLAATQACTVCGTRLETIVREGVTGDEKK